MLMAPDQKLLVHMEQFLELFKAKLANKSFTVVGDGNQKRDFVYVVDLVEAFIYLQN